MSLTKSIFIAVFVCVSLPLMAVAQNNDPVAAGATPLSANFDVWPNFLPDSDYHSFDIAGIGKDLQSGREEFAFGGYANDTQCGPKVAVVSQNGVEVPAMDGLLDDNGTAFFGAAAGSPEWYGVADGWGWRAVVDGDPNSGNFISSYIIFINDSSYHVFSNPVQAFVYCEDATSGPQYVNDHYLCQRFNRDGAPVSDLTAGRNVPSAASHSQSPWFPAGGHESRVAGNAILSNGNSLHYIADRSRSGGGDVDKGVVEYFSENGLVPGLNNGTSHRCNVHTITSPDANTFVVSTTPTFVNPTTKATFDNANTQMAASGLGWFAMRADSNGGTLAFFRNDGSRITQIYGYQTTYQDTVDLLPNDDDIIVLNGTNSISASNDTLFVVCRYQQHADGINRPAVLRFKLNAGLTTVTPLPIIIADSDFSAPAAAPVHEGTIDVGANAAGAFVVGWRRDPAEESGGGAPVVRVFAADGTPATGSFYPSSLADPKTDTALALGAIGNQTVKVSINGNVVCVGWPTENGVATVDAPDCSGVPKSQGLAGIAVSTAARLFSIPGLVETEVGNWDLY